MPEPLMLKSVRKMTKYVLLCLILTITSISLVQCSKTSPDKSNVMTTTEAMSKADNSKSTINSMSVMNDDSEVDDDVDLMAVMTMCNESFRIEMSFLTSLNESGSFPDETDKTPKCFLRCVLQSLEIASLGDGKIDPERATAIFKGMRNGTPEDILEISTYCAQRDEKCHCEMAYNYLKCFFSMEIEKYDGENLSKS